MVAPFLLLLWLTQSHSFVLRPSHGLSTSLNAAGEGFGSPKKTYEQRQLPRHDPEAMADFFETYAEWNPLFAGLAQSNCLAAQSNLLLSSSTSNTIDFHEASSPWFRRPAIPTKDNDRAFLAAYLDGAQAALLQIPVTEEDDDHDLQFVEEGRRLLTLSRFHVIQERPLQSNELFGACWSELYELVVGQQDEHNGSLLLVPDSDRTELELFAERSVREPLEWLGLSDDLEVCTLEVGAIRMIYRLKDIPQDRYNEDGELLEDED